MKDTISKENKLLNIKDAAAFASGYLNKEVSDSNISYLIQYGKIKKHVISNTTFIEKDDLIKYYNSYQGKRQVDWTQKLGSDVDWSLSFDKLREKDTTKHVHRLHPYKGKFIPQLVEHFLSNKNYFKEGDIILDPFCGSGTTMVQANELKMDCIGIDISEFNCLIANSKVADYDFLEMNNLFLEIDWKLKNHSREVNIEIFEEELLKELYDFNKKHFPTPEFRYRVNNDMIDEKEFGYEKAKEFLPTYHKLIDKYRVNLNEVIDNSFISKWYFKNIKEEINIINGEIDKTSNPIMKNIFRVLLSRTIRSCRATTHSDLATLKSPQLTTYYCSKHKKICKPLFSLKSKWEYYFGDTKRRLEEFAKIKSNTFQFCLAGDSRNIDIFNRSQEINKSFYKKLTGKKIKGIFSSPPYVGMIDYHDQHSYSYELFGIDRRDEYEIGPKSDGQSKKAKERYIENISQVLLNSKQFLSEDYDIFIVANDKYILYPSIAKNAGLRIIKQFKRPVLNRTERDKGAYSEIIFHFKE
jgi:hypothetical protein